MSIAEESLEEKQVTVPTPALVSSSTKFGPGRKIGYLNRVCYNGYEFVWSKVLVNSTQNHKDLVSED